MSDSIRPAVEQQLESRNLHGDHEDDHFIEPDEEWLHLPWLVPGQQVQDESDLHREGEHRK